MSFPQWDAVYAAAAIREKVEEFITSELPGKPLFRVKELGIRSLQSFAGSICNDRRRSMRKFAQFFSC